MKIKKKNKKRYSSLKHKKELKRRKEINFRKNNRGTIYSTRTKVHLHRGVVVKDKIIAPKDLRFIQNPSHSLVFFNKLRNRNNISEYNRSRHIEISLYSVEQIDFATISILKSIFGEYGHLGVSIRGNYPKDTTCKQNLIDAGFFKDMTDRKGHDIITVKTDGDHHKFKKASGKIKHQQLQVIEKISEEAYEHLHGNAGYFDDLETVLKEIGGNAIQWGRAFNMEWQIGILKSNKKVTITVTDLGRGILDSLYISNKLKLIDWFFMHNRLDVIIRAFERKYGSYTQEPNRNLGLPMIKYFFDTNFLKNLYVCSNEAFVDFGNRGNSRLLKNDFERFNGTFYQWELSL